jgi:ketosteroid isomerase-like protein
MSLKQGADMPPLTPSAVARLLYDAMQRSDGQALVDLLTDDFVGTVSAGMPHGVGGDHRGAVDMVAGVWGRIAELYDMHVEPSEYLEVDDRRVVVLGRYRGSSRADGTTVDAAFAHVIATRGDQVAALQQITDTARWVIPALA